MSLPKHDSFFNFYWNSPLAYQSLDEQGYFIDINAAWLRMMGYGRDEVIGRHFSEFLEQECALALRGKWCQFKTDGEIWGFEHIMRHKDGTTISISLDGRIAYDHSGSFIQTHCLLYDISERKLTEEKLRASEEKYRILTEHMEDVVWRLDLKTMKILYVSPSIERLRGFTVDEIMAQSFEEQFSPTSYAYFQQIYLSKSKQALQNSDARTLLVDIFEKPCKDGTTIWVEASCRVYRREDGGVEVIGVSRNYTKQQQQQQELTAVNHRLKEGQAFIRAIIDAAPCLLVCIGKDGNIQYINNRCADQLQIERYNNELLPASQYLPLHLQDKHKVLLAQCLQGNRVDFLDETPLPNDPDLQYIYGVYNPVFNSSGEVERAIIASMDISEQKRLEEQLSEAQRIGKMGSWEWDVEKDRFICSAELRTLFDISQQEVDVLAHDAFINKIHPEDLPRCELMLLHLLSNHKHLECDYRVVWNDGRVKTLQSSGRVLLNHEGKIRKAIGTTVDISDRVQMEQALKEAALRLREFAKTIPDVAFITDENGDIIELFGKEELVLGKTRRDKTNHSLTQFMSKKTAGLFLDGIKQAVENNTLQFGEYEFNTPKGKRIYETRIAPMSYQIAGKRTVACNAIDVTEQKRIQKLLQLSYEKRRQQELLNGLVEGKIKPSPSVLDEAWRVKLNLSQTFSCYVLQIQEWRGQPRSHWLENRNDYQYLMDSLVGVFESETEAIVWESKEGLGILDPLQNSENTIKQQEYTTATAFQNIATTHFPDLILTIGIADLHIDTFRRLAQCYAEASKAVYLGGVISPDRRIHHYLDLGILQILPSLSDKEEVDSFVERTIGKLIMYDQKKGSQLLDTLEKILKNENLKIVAEQLFVHHKTIVFRKNRIEKILDLSLDKFETRLTLSTALKLRQICLLKE